MAKINQGKVNLGTVQFGERKRPLYYIPATRELQVTSKGPPDDIAGFLCSISKGTARRVRKALRRAGFNALAGIRVDRRNFAEN